VVSRSKRKPEKGKARAELLSVGAQDMPVGGDEVEQAIDTFELAVLREVMANSSISGNASEYVLRRIEELEKTDGDQ
jgi:hypothetical protein